MEMHGQIYRLTNKVNGKMYHGQTTDEDVNNRWYDYKTLNCKGQPKLYNAIKKYGWDNFLAEVIDTANDQSQLDNLEISYIAKFDSMNNGYNCTEGGRGGKKSEETKRKLSEAQKGSKNHQFGKTGNLSPCFGVSRSDETKRKLSESHKGKMNHQYGKPLSEETKRKMSETCKLKRSLHLSKTLKSRK